MVVADLAEVAHRQRGPDLLVLGELEHVGQGLAARGPPELGQLVDLQPVGAAARREEQDVGVGRRHEQAIDEVGLAGLHPLHALATAALRPVLGQRIALDVAGVGHGHDHVLLDDQVLRRETLHRLADLGPARVAELLLDLAQLVDHDLADALVAAEQILQIRNLGADFLELVEDPLALHRGQRTQSHFQDGVGLALRELEAGHQLLAGRRRVRRVADDRDHLVEVLEGDREAEDLHERVLVAAASLNEVDGGKAWQKIAADLRSSGADRRLALLDALHDVEVVGPAAIEALEKCALGTKDWRVVAMALRCLAFQDSEASPKALSRRKKHKRWQVRLAMAEALRGYRNREALDALVGLLGDAHLRVRRAAAESLTFLTGRDLGSSQKRWKSWLKEQGRDFAVPSRTEAKARRRVVATEDERYDRPRYYDIEIPSNRLVFVLDKSESMDWGPWDGAVDQVEEFLAAVGPTTSFALIEFAEDAKRWKKRAVPANKSSLKKGLGFLRRTKPHGPTNIIDALRLAMDLDDCDTIVLLSDGVPNRGDPSRPADILAALERENRHLRFEVHTVQLLIGRYIPHDAPADAEKQPLDEAEKQRRASLRERADANALGQFLSKLARRHGGFYTVAFGDRRVGPPGSGVRPTSDK